MGGSWSFAASPGLVLIAMAVVVASGWMCWMNWKGSGGRRLVGMLESLRFVLILLLAGTLLRPEFVLKIERGEAPEVAVLADTSGSMRTEDLLRTNQLTSRMEWIREQQSREFWSVLEPEVEVRWEEFSPAPEESETNRTGAIRGTDLGGALEGRLKRSGNLKAVLLLSDGDWNVGTGPVGVATRYRQEGVPVYTVGVGRETPLPDIEMEKLSLPAYMLFGEQISIPFTVRSYLPRVVETVVRLEVDGVEVSSKEVRLPAMGEVQEAVVWMPERIGEASLRLSVPVLEEETIEENNEQTARIDVRVETLKVLVIDSLPRWEYRFLRNALERDPGVEMHCLLFHPGMGAGGGRHYLPDLPASKEWLSRYDVVFVGDVGIGEGELEEDEAGLLRGLVEQQASGLVLMPGARGRHYSLIESDLGELYPVRLDEERREGIGLQNQSNLMLSSQGKGHLLTRFAPSEERNEALWSQLPGFYWSASVEKSRPGSEVLAVHSSLRNQWGRLPLLVTRPHGNGKVLFMGTDSAWRWRLGVEDKYHYRFWSQVVRWMAHQRHLSERDGVRLTYSPETPVLGDQVFLQATVLDQSGFPIEEGSVEISMTSPSGRMERILMEPTGGGWGVYTARYSPREGGDHMVRVEAARHDREMETLIRVQVPQLEEVGKPINATVLKEIAAVSGGQYGSAEQLDELVKAISLLPEREPAERRVRLWSHPWWGGLLLALLGIYWTGRKVAGMV